MRLTLHTDYAMRVLLHLGANAERLTSIAEIARTYGISRNHLMKVVQNLSKAGLVSAVRETEDGFRLVDCSQCLIAGVCELPPVLNQATQAFLAVLDSHSVASMLLRRQELQNLFGRVGSERAAGPRLARRSGTAKSPETLRSARAAPLSANAR